MQRNSTTAPQVNKVKIAFTKRKMTAYGGFALIAAFFERIGFAQMIEKAIPISECSPNGMGIYGKTIAFIAMVFAGAERFSHLVYLGNKEVLARMFGVKRLPDAATTITRMFGKLTTIKAADALSRNVWAYLSTLIPWTHDSRRLAHLRLQRASPLRGTGRGEEGIQPHQARQAEPQSSFGLSQQKQVCDPSVEPLRQRWSLEQHPCLLCRLL